MKDLNAANVESAMSMVMGTARSMGVTVKDQFFLISFLIFYIELYSQKNKLKVLNVSSFETMNVRVSFFIVFFQSVLAMSCQFSFECSVLNSKIKCNFSVWLLTYLCRFSYRQLQNCISCGFMVFLSFSRVSDFLFFMQEFYEARKKV